MFRSFKLLSILTIICCAVEAQVSGKVIVFEIPLGIETYVPVTVNDIEERAFKVVSLRNERQASEAIALIHQTQDVSDPKKIRLKIVTGDEFYVFDARGIGVSSSGKSVKIDIGQLEVVISN